NFVALLRSVIVLGWGAAKKGGTMVEVGQSDAGQQFRIVHVDAGVELQFRRGRVEMHCDGEVGYFSSANLSNAACMIISRHPDLVSINDLREEMKVAVHDRASPAVYRNMANI